MYLEQNTETYGSKIGLKIGTKQPKKMHFHSDLFFNLFFMFDISKQKTMDN